MQERLTDLKGTGSIQSCRKKNTFTVHVIDSSYMPSTKPAVIRKITKFVRVPDPAVGHK